VGPFRRVCVFCGSNSGADAEYARAASEMGQLLAAQHIGLVYGGGNVGLMGQIADAALAAGGEVIGVIPRHLEARELAHRGLTELRVVASMHERKATMADLSDAFIALPGGLGTLEEIFEVATWRQLGIHVKPVGFLNVAGYYDLLDAFLAASVDRGFVRAEHRRLMVTAREPAALLTALNASGGERVDRWLDRSER
jgi:uncharacterized protein (TIGR00730 family)